MRRFVRTLDAKSSFIKGCVCIGKILVEPIFTGLSWGQLLTIKRVRHGQKKMVNHLVPVSDYKVGALGPPIRAPEDTKDVCGLALFWCKTIRPLLINDDLFCIRDAFQGVQLLAVEGRIERLAKGEQLLVNDSLHISKNSQQNISGLQSGLGLGTLPNIVYSNFDCAE